jgi:FixJ family two-component response regulator
MKENMQRQPNHRLASRRPGLIAPTRQVVDVSLRRRPALLDRAILIIEDEFLIAADLANQIVEDGGKVAGPVLTLEEAISTLKQCPDLGGVILDVNVGGFTTFDLADELMETGIPFVFFTGYRSVEIPDRFLAVPQITKPAGWRQIKKALMSASERLANAGIGSFRDSIEAALPTLRRKARTLVKNPEDADRLVEQTLEKAISAVGDRSLNHTIEDWLLSLLARDGTNTKRQLLH